MSNKKRRELVDYLKYHARVQEILQNAMGLLENMPECTEREKLREEVREYLYNNHYVCNFEQAHPLKPEYKQIIRDDFSGDIYTIDKEYLSFHYRYALKNSGIEDYKAQDYDAALNNNEAWKNIREFGSYRSIEEIMKQNLKKQKLPPYLIKAMDVNDFRDYVRNNCREEFKEYRAEHSFVKEFITNKESEFRQLLAQKGIDKRYIDALVDKMQTYGKACSVEVYDEQNKRIDGPEFDVHHIDPVHSPSNIQNLCMVNDNDNLCLIEKKAHHYLHALERVRFEKQDMYFEKIKVPNKAVCIVDFENYILHDFHNPEQKLCQKNPKKENVYILNQIGVTYIDFAEKFLKLSKGKNKAKKNGPEKIAKDKYGMKR